MVQDIFFVATAHILVVHRLVRLAIDPTNMQRTVFQTPVKVLDIAHHPSHLDATFDREFTSHSPCSGAAPGADFSKTGDNDALLEINHATKLGNVTEGIDRLKVGEFKSEIRSRYYINRLK